MIVSGIFHPEIGGPSRYLYHLAKYLHEQGHQVCVIAFSAEPTRHRYPYKVIRILRKVFLPFRLLQMFFHVLVQGVRADLIFVNDYGIPPVLANKILRKPLVLKIVGDWAWEYSIRHQLYSDGIEAFQKATPHGRCAWVKKLQRLYVSQADQILTPSHYLRQIVEGWLSRPVPIQVIYNALDGTSYQVPSSKIQARQELGYSFPYILTIARLNPWKGVDAVLRSLKKLPPEIHYVVLGEGPEFPRLQALSEELQLTDRVHLLGACPLEEVGTYLKGAELLVLYTGYEGLSHVLLEALLVGLPILTTAIGGNPEVVSSPDYGVLVPYGEDLQLEKELLRLLTNPQELEKLAAGSLKRSHDFSWPVLLEQTLRLFLEVRSRNTPLS